MTDPLCATCGHVNRVGAAVCEMCDARLDADARPSDGGQPGGARGPFAPTGEPSRTASDASSCWLRSSREP